MSSETGAVPTPAASPFVLRAAAAWRRRGVDAVAHERARLMLWRAGRRGTRVGTAAEVPPGSVLSPGTSIGTRTSFTGPLFVEGPGTVEIGPWCAVGHGLRVVTTQHNTRVANMHVPLQHLLGLPSYFEARGPVHIGGASWIGDTVTVLGGVTIGPGAVIGAGSVVSRDVAPFAVVGGNPARQIRLRFDPELVDVLLEVAWWDWPLERILRNRPFFEADLTGTTAADCRALVAG